MGSPISVLYLTTESPYPATSGGRVRSLAQIGLLSSLPEVQKITVVSLREEPLEENHVRELEKLFPKVRTVPPIFHPIHIKQHLHYAPLVLAERAMGRPYLAGKWASPRIFRQLRRVSGAHSFDVVYIDHLGMMRYAKQLKKHYPRARVVLEQHNVESDFFGQFAEKKHGIVRQLAKMEHRLASSYEREQVGAADHVVAISEQDAAQFRAMGQKNVTFVPQLVLPKTRLAFAPTNGNILYVGNLGWHPNVAGLDWFFAEVWPKLRAASPDVTMRVCGSGLKKTSSGAPIVPSEWQKEGVTVVGFVDDLAPEYARAAALAAPVHGGSGVRIKLLEGMAYGVPIVTTQAGAEGLPLRDGDEIMVADSAEEFAQKMLELVRSPKRGSALREAAFRYLEEAHGEGKAQLQMRRALGLVEAEEGDTEEAQAPARVLVDGLAFDDLTLREATAYIAGLAKLRDRPRYVCTGNLDHLALAEADALFREAYEHADVVLADGAPVVWLSKFGELPLRARVAGSEIFWTLGEASAKVGLRIFLLGGVLGAAEGAKAELERRYPGTQIVGTYCPPRETFDTEEEQERIRSRVQAANPDILFVAFGAPKQEKWIYEQRYRLGVPVSIGVGGTFEMASGMMKQAPVWVRSIGFEWAFRFLQEPRRLYERYVVRDMPHLAKATFRALRTRS